MKIVHTADWHVGRTIRGRSRNAEHIEVLGELVALVEAERADLVLVAGDQFDTAAPSAESERVVYRTLLDLAATGAEVLVVAGNHDNPSRWEALAPLLAAGGVRVAPRVVRPDEGGVARVTTRSGEEALVALVPFLSKRTAVRADALMSTQADEQEQHYAGKVKRVVERLCAGFRGDAVNLLVGHLMVAGASAGGGERPGHTVFEYAVPATVFPPSAHLVALGHLHRPQKVPAPAPVWYAGSPLQLDFGETGDRKATLVVEARPGRPAEVRMVPVAGGRRLRTLAGPLAELEAQRDTTGDDYLRVVVEGAARAGLADTVREWFPHAVDVSVARPESPGGRGDSPRRLGRPPQELFAEYLADRGASDERVEALFAELHADETAG